MAALVLTGAQVQVGTAWTGTAPGTPGTQTIAGTITSPSDISAYCNTIEMPWNVATLDATNFGSGTYMVYLAGLKSSDVKIGVNQDYASAAIDSLIRGWFGTTVFVDIKATNAARGVNNPSYVCAAIVNQYVPILGAVGAKAAMSVQWMVTGAYTVLTA